MTGNKKNSYNKNPWEIPPPLSECARARAWCMYVSLSMFMNVCICPFVSQFACPYLYLNHLTSTYFTNTTITPSRSSKLGLLTLSFTNQSSWTLFTKFINHQKQHHQQIGKTTNLGWKGHRRQIISHLSVNAETLMVDVAYLAKSTSSRTQRMNSGFIKLIFPSPSMRLSLSSSKRL